MSKQKVAKKDNLPILLLFLCCTLLISFWFFRAKTVQAPDPMSTLPEPKIEFVKESDTSTKSNLNEIDKELKKLEIQEKGL